MNCIDTQSTNHRSNAKRAFANFPYTADLYRYTFYEDGKFRRHCIDTSSIHTFTTNP